MALRSDSTEKQHPTVSEDLSAAHRERSGSPPLGKSGDRTENDDDFGFSPEHQRKIIRRVDRRLVLTCGALYCISLMDRTNMSAASIAGMNVELKLIDNRYNIANLVFFVTYIIFQPPSTIVIRALGPRAHLAGITLLWGALMIGFGFVKKWEQLTALRALLGVLEAGFFPSCVYLLSTWYTRYEVGKRYAIFGVVGCVAAGFAGVLAYGVIQLNGKAGLSGWRWIFIIEGAITCACAILGYWLLVDFPDSARKSWSFLRTDELRWVVNRVEKDRGDAQLEAFKWSKFFRGGKDWKIWVFALIFFFSTCMTYSLAYTLPIILVSSMHFSVGAAQCLAAPPYAFAGLVMFLMGWLGDKYHIRGPVIVANMVLCLIGLPIMGWASSAGARYCGVFLVAAGANANVPTIMAFQANNIRGQWKRAFCSATLVGFGGIGGIVGSLIFREQDKLTGYKPGFWACIAAALLNIILACTCSVIFMWKNKKADRGEVILEDGDAEHAAANFRYTL
ncbi:hypothetical protein E4U19_008111 [Claviceps sp. Clav32 group G5]|nr:hypothetical protein E4U40_007512 [Claviceps sp. LM458 group G5]KAG6031288.1 hypothetical protein E4U19_008111 [Claviceps sp. Clav32 group G5]